MKILEKIKIKYISIISLVYLFSANFVTAELTGPGGITPLKNPIKAESISELLGAILDLIVKIGLPIVTIAIIFAGFKFVSARGSATKIEEAKRALVYVLIGAAIVLGAKALQIVITGTVDDIKASL